MDWNKLRSELAPSHANNPQNAALFDHAVKQAEDAFDMLARIGHDLVVTSKSPPPPAEPSPGGVAQERNDQVDFGDVDGQDDPKKTVPIVTGGNAAKGHTSSSSKKG